VVGDSPYDAEAAGKISLRTIGVLSGGFSLSHGANSPLLEVADPSLEVDVSGQVAQQVFV
jgi:phosphoglycolate phosphatase-like HAD superfamily hydrolase